MKMEKKMNLTKEQQIFYVAMKKMKELQKNPEENLMEIQRIQLFLWEKIKLFAKKEMFRMVGEYTSADERMDIEQDMVMIFLEKLPYYNPLRLFLFFLSFLQVLIL